MLMAYTIVLDIFRHNLNNRTVERTPSRENVIILFAPLVKTPGLWLTTPILTLNIR